MRVIDREKKRASLDTTNRLKAAHRSENSERAKVKNGLPVSLREFARGVMGGEGVLADYAKQWFEDKRRTEHPKRARSKFVVAERAQRRWARRAKGNPKGKKAK